MGALVRAEGITRQFTVGEEVVHALSDVSFEAGAGAFTAIVGRSGSGKTTLLNIIGGLDHADAGSVFLGDLDLMTLRENELTELRRKDIGFVFQSFGLLPLLSAYENIELALRIAGAGPRHRGERTRELLELVGLTRRAKHRPYELSGGEQQRVAVARALANQPRLLIADEPTGELDSQTAAGIFQLLQQISSDYGTCIIASTHDLAIRDRADAVITLQDGRVVAQSGPEPVSGGAPAAVAVAAERDEPGPAVFTGPTDIPDEPADDINRWARPRE